MAFILKKYSGLLTKHPLVTKSVTGGVLAMLSDLICQELEKSDLPL